MAVLVVIAFVVATPFFQDGEEEVEKVKEASMQSSIREKLNEIVIPELKFDNVAVEEAVEFLRLRSIECDPSDGDDSQKGVGFVVGSQKVIGGDLGDEFLSDEGFGDAVDLNATLITFQASEIGLADALDLTCEKAGLRWKIDSESHKIVILPRGADPVP